MKVVAASCRHAGHFDGKIPSLQIVVTMLATVLKLALVLQFTSPCVAQAVTVTGNIPYANNLLRNGGVLDIWNMSRVRDDKIYTVNPGGTTVMEKDIRSRSRNLGYHSKRVEKTEGYADKNKTGDTPIIPQFSGTLDMTGAVLPAIVAILVDDKATLTVTEDVSTRPPGVTGPAFVQPYPVDGTALWNPKSYKEFDVPIPPGRKYKLTLDYANVANLTKRYGGKVDVDGVSVYLCLSPVGIKEVSFAGSNYHQLKSDDGNITYSAPHWVDVNGDSTATTNNASGEKNYPVAFTRNTKPKVGGKFTVAGLPAGQNVKIKASTTQGLQIPETSVTPDPDGTIILPPTEATNSLSNSIQFYNTDDSTAFKIDWQISAGSAGWSAIGSTKHTVYVTRADPILSAKNLMLETLFNIGCRNAKGKGDDEQAVVDAIYENFKKRDVQKVKQSSGSLDGQAMKYWGNPGKDPFETADMLATGSGRCDAWVKTFIDVLRTQGVDASLIVINPPQIKRGELQEAIQLKFPKYQGNVVHDQDQKSPTVVVLAKSWNTSKPFAPVDLMGMPAQGMKDPQSYFSNHAIVKYGDKYYDPSYGSVLFSSFDEYENASFDGIGIYFRTDIALPEHALVTPKLPGKISIWVWKQKQKGVTLCTPVIKNY